MVAKGEDCCEKGYYKNIGFKVVSTSKGDLSAQFYNSHVHQTSIMYSLKNVRDAAHLMIQLKCFFSNFLHFVET